MVRSLFLAPALVSLPLAELDSESDSVVLDEEEDEKLDAVELE